MGKMSAIRSIGFRLFLAALSFVFVLFLLEISLNVAAGFLNRKSIASVDRSGSRRSSIACFGDSYTYGLGADSRLSYPAQLESLLEKEGHHLKVVNCGMPGKNSRQTLIALRNVMNTLHPDIVLVMVGLNNSWNFEGVEENNFPWSLFSGTRIGKMSSIFKANLKSWILKRQKKKLSYTKEDGAQSAKKCPQVLRLKVEELIRQGRSQEAREEIVRMLSSYPGDSRVEKEMANFERDAGNYKSARAYAELAISHKTTDEEEAFARLEMVYLDRADGRWQEAVQEMLRAVIDTETIKSIYPELKNVCQAGGLNFSAESRKLRNAIAKIHGKTGVRIWDRIAYADRYRDTVNKLVESDLQLMQDTVSRNKAQMVLLTYPNREAEINQAIRQFAKEKKIPLLDTELFFLGKPRSEYFAADGHCNANGYGVIAKAVYDMLLEQRRLEKNNISEVKS